MDIILKAKLNAYTKGTISGATLSKIYTSKIDEQVPLDLIDEETKLPIYSIKKHFVIEVTDNPQHLLEVLQNINKILDYNISISNGTNVFYGLESLSTNYVSDDYVQGFYIKNNNLYLDLILEENKNYIIDIQVIFE